MDVSGKIRLWTRWKISTLTLSEHDSVNSWKDYNDEGEEEGREEDREENREEEKEVSERCILGFRFMMRLLRAVSVISLLSSTTAAHAVSITNRDEHDHKITVMEGEAKSDQVLKPAQALNGVCMKGCTIRLNDSEDDEYQLEADDVVSIEDGSLYYDGPDTPAEPAPAPAKGDKPAGKG